MMPEFYFAATKKLKAAERLARDSSPGPPEKGPAGGLFSFFVRTQNMIQVFFAGILFDRVAGGESQNRVSGIRSFNLS